MILRYVCWSFFLYLAFGPKVNSEVTVDNKGYQNVIISIAPNIPSKDGENLIIALQELLEKASSVLHTAIGIPIASVTFGLPPSWSTETWKNISVKPETQTAARPDILVDSTEESPFKNQPISLQYGGCGVPGHQIILNRYFLSGDRKFPKGKLLAREWLKYRYGVFDEHGFNDDVLFPKFSRVPGSSEIRITECSDPKVNYVFRRAEDKPECDMSTSESFFCHAYPDENSENVTSSLMFYHENLPNMEHICGKDGHQHNSAVFNKQNAQCNGRSIWDVIKQSEDFQNTQQQSSPKPIQFSYSQESKPNLVVLLENSDNFHEKEIPSVIQFALRRFYYDLPSKRKLAIYTYNSDATLVLPYAELPPVGERSDLRVIADFGLPAKNVCTSCGLAKATEILLQNDGMEKGSVLLITSSPLDKVPDFSKNMKDSGICLHILRFTGEQNPGDQSYDVLSPLFNCFSQRPFPDSLNTLEAFDSVFNFLFSFVPIFGEDSEIKTTVTGEISGILPMTIPRDPSASLYTLWLNKVLASSSIECKAGEKVVALKPGTTGTDISSFTFDPVDDNVTCKFASDKQDPALYQIQKSSQLGSYFSSEMWIHDRSTDKEQLPILIYASIYYGGYPVKNANVKTVVTFGNKEENVEMIDNGRGDPDITQADGIYSGYFANFLETGTYQITVTIDDHDGEAKAGKESKSAESIPCCGGYVPSEDLDIPDFRMVRVTLYNAKNKRPQDGYPPSKIIDLQAVKATNKIALAWSSPGPAKAARYILKFFQNKDDAIAKFDTTGREFNTTGMIPGPIGKREALFNNVTDFDVDATYYAAIRSINEFNKQSEISNVVKFVANPKATTTSTTQPSTTVDGGSTDDGTTNHDPPKSGSKTTAIVLGVLGGIAVLGILVYLGYYYFIKKPRRN